MPASGGEADIVLVFGGDGTVHRHLSGLVKLALPVLVVAAGSGNDFARALGLGQIRDSILAWKEVRRSGNNMKQIDLGIISPIAGDGQKSPEVAAAPHYFCCVAGVGLDSEVARRANALPRWLRAHGGYVMSLLPAVLRFAPAQMTVSSGMVPGDPAGSRQIQNEKPTTLAAFANTPTYGGGMRIAPNAKLDDGLLDICIVEGMNPFKLFCMFPTVYSGRHLKVHGVNYLQAERIRIESKYPQDVYADGEYVCRTPVEVSVAKAALQVVVP